MKFYHKPNFIKKLIAFIIVIAIITEYSNGIETHTFITWMIGSSVLANLGKALLLVVAFILACVTINLRETD